MDVLNISIIGAGKVGSAMAEALNKAGHRIISVLSRTKDKAILLADKYGAVVLEDNNIPVNVDLVIITVPDNYLKRAISKLVVPENCTLVHTAGSFGLEVYSENALYAKGVIYPLQTFTEDRVLDFKDIPLFIESDNIDTYTVLEDVASSLGSQVFKVDSKRRRMLHLAAVFVCNFVNHMYYAGQSLCQEANIPFSVFEPLIRETFFKAINIGPEMAQTGPALRNDENTIEKHMDLLSFSLELRTIYKTVTESIIRHYSNNK